MDLRVFMDVVYSSPETRFTIEEITYKGTLLTRITFDGKKPIKLTKSKFVSDLNRKSFRLEVDGFDISKSAKSKKEFIDNVCMAFLITNSKAKIIAYDNQNNEIVVAMNYQDDSF